MKKIAIIFVVIGAVIGILAGSYGLGFWGMSLKKTFKPISENIDREVFENTKSYTQGMIRDLAKYYEEYQKAQDNESRMAIVNLIKLNYSSFDESKITNDRLKYFLTEIRGY